VPTARLSSLIEDFTLLVRSSVSSAHVSTLVEGLEAGDELPPLLIDKATRRIVDGFHRTAAYRRFYGEDAEVPVTLRSFTDESAVFIAAVEANVARGLDLNRWDIMRIVELADERNIPVDTLARLVHWRPDRLAEYRDSRMAITRNGRRIALKRSIRHRLGTTLNDRQVEANAHLSGMSPLFHVNQLLTLLGADLMPDSEQLREGMAQLMEAATRWLDTTQTKTEEESNVSV
jgi:hypothetical protein